MERGQQLLRKRQRLLRSLPPLERILRASLFERFRRCGKRTCHCARGRGHRAFYLSVTFTGGRTTQLCLPDSLVPQARSWIGNYVRLWRFIEEVSAINRELLRERWVESPRRKGASR
jgi:hypothetical protein